MSRDPETVSYNMSRIKSKDTAIEVSFAKRVVATRIKIPEELKKSVRETRHRICVKKDCCFL